MKDKVVWITGASSGIGEAVAYAFAKEGAKLVLSARRQTELERVKQNITNTDVLILPLDMEKFADLPSKAEQVMQTFGKIDILFNNAGMSQRSSLLETELEVYQRLINLNFLGQVALTKAVLPFMVKEEKGHIVVVSSVAGKIGTSFRTGYSASKHALHGFFDSLRSEVFPHHIKITILCPGYIRTSISVNALTGSGETYKRMDENQTKGMSPEECASRIIKAIKQQKEEVYIGGKEIIAIYLKRFFPRILSRILVKNSSPK